MRYVYILNEQCSCSVDFNTIMADSFHHCNPLLFEDGKTSESIDQISLVQKIQDEKNSFDV